MNVANDRVTIKGSKRGAAPGAVVIGPCDESARATVLLELRRREQPPAVASHKRVFSRQELKSRFGASAGDLARVREFAESFGLSLVAESAAKRTVELAGTVTDLNRAFGVELQWARVDGTTFRQRVGTITVPKDLAPIVLSVLGLDDRPQAQPRYKAGRPGEFAVRAGSVALTPLEVAELYRFPPGDGTGQTIALVELGGGFSQSDLNVYFQGLGLPVPKVTAVSVSGGANRPGVDPGSDGEVMLDIEVAGAVAPAANQLVYFAPNSSAGFLAAVNAAIHDSAKPPSVISISWGNPETKWTAQTMQAMERSFQDAANLGIPVTVASGDGGSVDGTSSLVADFPSSAPHALGCGGTHLQGAGSTISSETVWNSGAKLGAGGGGVSKVFAKPAYQGTSNTPPAPGGTGGRGIPDVAANAAAESPYKVRVGGKDTEEWGTSAVAPLMAGLVARMSQKLGRPLGFLNTLIYEPAVTSSSFRDITQGNNDIDGHAGSYSAKAGWDACTGVGSPIGTALLAALQSQSTTPSPTVTTPKPTPTPKPTTPKPTVTPKPTTPKPTKTPKPTTPKPTKTPQPTQTPNPTQGTGSTGDTGDNVRRLYPRSSAAPSYYFPSPPSTSPAPAATVAAKQGPGWPSLAALGGGGGAAVPIVGIVGLAAVVAVVATVGIVGVVATAKSS